MGLSSYFAEIWRSTFAIVDSVQSKTAKSARHSLDDLCARGDETDSKLIKGQT